MQVAQSMQVLQLRYLIDIQIDRPYLLALSEYEW